MGNNSDPVTRVRSRDVDNNWIRSRNSGDDLIGRTTFTDYILFHFFGGQPDTTLVCTNEYGITASAITRRMSYLSAAGFLQGAVAVSTALSGAHARFIGPADDLVAHKSA